jgi:hypothetical protein
MRRGREAYLAVLLGELEGVDEAEGLVDGAADWEVVDCDLVMLAPSCDSNSAQSPVFQFRSSYTKYPKHTCLTTPFGSIKNSPLNAIPSSSISTPYALLSF